jgi:HEAT repeat protein
MSKKLNRATWNSIVGLVLLTSILTVNLCAFAVTQAQNNVESKIAQAVSLFKNKEISKALAIFREVGDPAIPAVMQLLHSDVEPKGAVLIYLSSFIASTKGERADAALIQLLADESSFLRGDAAREVGNRKLSSALPKLIGLLSDTEVHYTISMTDPYREKNILVRDSAVEALQSITGKVLAKGKSRDEQVKAWLEWWRKQRKRG